MRVPCLLTVLLLAAVDSLRIKVSHTLAPHIPLARRTSIPTLKLPVWPVWSGVVAQILEWTGQSALASQLISNIGGRVVPMQLSDANLSPFLLLAHHTHSFMPLDPFREATKLFLPEGFPAHPHSGFDTVTYCIQGGLRHRDSEGVQMTYGNGDTQWMRAGRGVIHEEMWDTGDYWNFKKIEIFQLWVNLKKQSKNDEPACRVIEASSVPVYIAQGTTVRVLCGQVESDDADVLHGPGSAVAASPMCIAHVSMEPNSKLAIQFPSTASAAAYARRGSAAENVGGSAPFRIGVHDLVTYSFQSPSAPVATDLSQLYFESGNEAFDCLLLLGAPIAEPVVWSGPVVEADRASFQVSSSIFNQVNELGGFWDFKLSDEAWKKHINELSLQGIIRALKGL